MAADRLPPKPRLAFVSHVLPFPANVGQSCRVRDFLAAIREDFHVTFIGVAPLGQVTATEAALREHTDDVVLMTAPLSQGAPRRALRRALGAAYRVATGLKTSNFEIGVLGFSPARIRALLAGHAFDLAVFQYWHATPAVRAFHDQGIPVALDMHNVLWRSRIEQLRGTRLDDTKLGAWDLARYRRREEQAWRAYDLLLAINTAEKAEAERAAPGRPVVEVPMGVDLDRWDYRWAPGEPIVAFYGSMGNERGRRDALRCHDTIMPLIWRERPDCKLWLLGSNPPGDVVELQRDDRVWVPGFVDDVRPLLAQIAVVLCPFAGTYGFRSRLVEVLGTGTPAVCTSDAVYGMHFADGESVRIADTDEAMARAALELLDDPATAIAQSRAGRAAALEHYDFAATYGQLPSILAEMLR
jgi:glycosyltransferase involved in cell wall biosynthesis